MITESQVIASVLQYILSQNNDVAINIKVNLPNKNFDKDKEMIIDRLKSCKSITSKKVKEILFSNGIGADIEYNRTFNTGRPQHKLHIEAKGDHKGGNRANDIKVSLGQLLTFDYVPSRFHQFAIAIPQDWKDDILRHFLNENGEVKPMIQQLMEGRSGLYFYLVPSEGNVERKTWRQFLIK